MSARQRIEEQPAYVLHSTSWRETSLIVEVFTRAHGRLPLVAKGARRPASPLRGLLMAFQPLSIGWSGRGEVKTLMDAQWRGGQPLLGGAALLSAYYLNELLLRLLPREDAHPRLFDAYAETLRQLAGPASIPPLLRGFELQLLGELGYAPSFDVLADGGQSVQEDGRYLFIIERGLVEATAGLEEAPVLPGHALLAMARGDFSAVETQQVARPLMRRLLQHYLGAQGLESRRIFMELQEL
ncbi:MAG: DNA repair protein RecO [Moraxellaceae bacterium]|nr:DNA repair protein RecO [Moraxellaceae bacterium]